MSSLPTTRTHDAVLPGGPWDSSPRWRHVRRDYRPEDVLRLRSSLPVEHTLARHGAERLWELLSEEDYVACLGALTGGQAVQMVKAGLQAIYLSGWQVAADANLAEQVYPDQSLYPANSVPAVVRRINNALQRADLVERLERGGGAGGLKSEAGTQAVGGNAEPSGSPPVNRGSGGLKSEAGTQAVGGNAEPSGSPPVNSATRDWFVPIVADAEAGFGGALNAYELMRAMVEAGAAGVHFEDQLASEKKCGHLGGKVLVPTAQFIRTLTAARLAADVAGVPTVLIARTDALAATLLTSDVDERDRRFCSGGRSVEGYHVVRGGMDAAVARALAYAPYADLLWCETSTPDLEQARRFAEAVHAEHPGKPLAYNCSPSFNWRRHLDDHTIAKFQKELGAMGYRFQFITLAGFHALNAAMFELANGYAEEGMPAYVRLQQRELDLQAQGYTATRHQREVGTGYFDAVAEVISAGTASTLALAGSTEHAQFQG